MSSRHLRPAVCGALFILATMAAIGCRDKAATQQSPARAAPARVSVARPVRKTLRRAITQPGQIEAFDQARLHAKIPAYVEKYLVDIGDHVQGPRFGSDGEMIELGQLLAELSAPEMERELEQKQALVAQAAADVEQSQAAIKVAQADTHSAVSRLKESLAAAERYEAEYQRWTSEYDRIVQLVSRSAVTQKLADETKSQKLAADAARKESLAKIESARSVVAASQAQVEKTMADEAATRARRNVAEAAHAHTAALLDYLKIEAPFDGTVWERNADIGYFAQGGGGNQEKPLFTIVRTDPVRVFVDLPEIDAVLTDAGDRAVVRVQSLPGEEFTGTVTRTSWALDPSTRTLRTEVDVPNAHARLRPGMYAQVTIDLAEKPEACTVNIGAVVSQENRLWCFIVENGKAVRKAVTLGLKSGNEVEIASGLTGDELVVQSKSASLTDGQTVETVDAARPK